MKNTKNLILVAMFAALTAVGAFIRIPLPFVPFTLQFLFCGLAGIILGSRLGALSQILYVGMGLIGLPVFTQGGGINYIFQPTFGYLLGFILAAYAIGKMRENVKEMTYVKTVIIFFIGLLLIYLLGVPYLYLISNIYLGKAMTVYSALFYGFVTTVPGDLVVIVMGSYVTVKMLPTLKKSGYIQ